MTVTEPGATVSRPGPGDAATSLTQYTGYLLRRAYARSLDCERNCLPSEAGMREIAVLTTLQHNGSTSQRRLGDLLHVNRSVMVKLVDSLERHGWVVRERNPDDRRSYALRVTDAGIAELATVRADLGRLERDLTSALDSVERRTLARHLRTLVGSVTTAAVDGLGDSTAFLVAAAHRELRDRAAGAFAALEIEPRDFGILAVVEAEQPCSRVLVAARIGVTPPAVQESIDALIDRGLIRSTTKAGDRRVHDLELTDDGTACLRAAREAATEIQSEVRHALGEPAEIELRALLMRIIR